MTDAEYIAMRLHEGTAEGVRPGRWNRLVQALTGQRADSGAGRSRLKGRP